MRNPIQPSPERPIPLPDRILMDAWWVDLKAETRPRAALSLAPDPAKLRLSGSSAAGAAGR